MFKKVCRLKGLVLVMMILFQVTMLAAEPIIIKINGVTQNINKDSGKPYVAKGTTMVPLAFVGESLGHKVYWEPSKRQVIIDDGKIVLTIDNRTVIINGKKVTLTSPPVVKNNRTYVPLRFVSTALGYGVDYRNNTVDITSGGGSIKPESNQFHDVLKWIEQGRIDTIPYKTGDPIINVINELGDGDPWTMQGIIVHTYDKYMINESLYSPIITGFAFMPGFELYGIKIGDSAQQIERVLGKKYTKWIDETGEGFGELSPDETAYVYYYNAGDNTLMINFDKNNKSLSAWFLGR